MHVYMYKSYDSHKELSLARVFLTRVGTEEDVRNLPHTARPSQL